MTPAMASEPYCAAAPSRSTSTRAIDAPEICERSAPCAPWLSPPPVTWTSAERCMRLPFTSTRIWSAGRPRRVGGRTKAEASPSKLRCWLNDGIRFFRIDWRLGLPCALIRSSLVKTSIGTALSATVRSVRRVPVTMIVESCSVSAAAALVATGVCALAAPASNARASAGSDAAVFLIMTFISGLLL